MYRKVVIGLLAIIALAMFSCSGKKHDANYYMEMVDSIRKAEEVAAIHKKAGIYMDPVEAWFDTLNVHTLPIRSAGTDIQEIGRFTVVPMDINQNFGFPVSAKLRAIALPMVFHRPVVLLAEMLDSVTPRLMVYTMDRKRHVSIDQLCIYDQKDENRQDKRGLVYQEYYITSKYEILLLTFFRPQDETKEPELLKSKKYVISQEGRFEEQEIEL